MATKAKEQGTLSIHTENIFPIIKKWLYSQHDIFFRELISQFHGRFKQTQDCHT